MWECNHACSTALATVDEISAGEIFRDSEI